MPTDSCRVCGRELFKEPLLRYENMPAAAQNLPDAAALAQEKGIDLTVCQCSGCGLVQLGNDPVPYHKDVIRAAGLSEVIRKSKTAQLAALVDRYSLRGKKIIEIGCGRGEFLSLLGPLPVEAYGLEHAPDSVAACRERGLRVTRGYLDADTRLADGPFHAFLLLMFLEHMPDPGSVLRGLYRNLLPGAIGLVEVPNFDMVLRDKLFSEFIGDHLYYFTHDTLRSTLETNGFDIVEAGELRDDYVISAVVRKRDPLDIGHFREYQAKIQAELDAYVRRVGRKRLAIWGAGHQALAILSLTKIADAIRYVVDGAPFKQGRYTPATHLPIVAPDTLRSDPVEAVVVIGGSYSDEIAAILRRDFDPHLEVSILRDFGLESVAR